MSRTRMVKPDFFQSRSLAKVSRDARLTFIGLWVEADAEGRGIAHPSILRGRIWPLDADITDATVVAHLHELARTGHITVYESDGDAFYAVNSWRKHQSAAYRTGESKLPAPETSEVLDPMAFDALSPGEMQEIVQNARPVVQLASTVVHKEKRREGKGMVTHVTDPDPFDVFWSEYPRKVSKEAARRAFAKAINLTPLDEMLSALRAQAKNWTDPAYTPHAATWLNGRRWEDEITEVRPGEGPGRWEHRAVWDEDMRCNISTPVWVPGVAG